VKTFRDQTVTVRLNLEIEDGKSLCSRAFGLGKASLLWMVAGLDALTSGGIYIDDKDVTDEGTAP
jgi:ABC-type sugar transport system ATPase subunit